MTLTYIIMGDPGENCRLKQGNRREWDLSKHIRHECALDIERQHGDNPLFTAPLIATVAFYHPTASKSGRHLYNTPYAQRPSISYLLRFVEEITNDILYGDASLIAAITVKKLYAKHPRTELTLQEI